MKKVLSLALILALTACTSRESTVVRAVEAQGMTNVQAKGYRFFGCSKDDDFHTGFEATNIRGEKVTGVVCGGWLKSSTVRID